MSDHKPLESLILVDFSHVLAVPACSYYLGLLGAEFIKVESPQKGDAIRHRGGTDPVSAAHAMSTSYLTLGAGKQSVTLDLETEQGLMLFHQLLERADILVENHIPKTMKRLGLDEASVRKKYPHLIYCSLHMRMH